MAGEPSDFDHSVLPLRPATVIEPASATKSPTAATLSYDSYLRVKSGISDSVLRMAGLPSAKELSYEAYVAALSGKAQPAQRPRGAARAKAILTKAEQKASEAWARGSGVARALVQGKRHVRIMSGAAVALLLVIVMGAGVSGHFFGGNDAGTAEENVIPAQATAGPIVLAVTQADEQLMNPVMPDLEQAAPLPAISAPTLTPPADQPAQAVKTAEVSTAAASDTKKKAAATAPKTVTAKMIKQPAKQVSANKAKKTAATAPKPVQAETVQAETVQAEAVQVGVVQAPAAQAGVKKPSPSPLGWLGQVFDDMSESLGGSESSTSPTTRRQTRSIDDRETKH